MEITKNSLIHLAVRGALAALLTVSMAGTVYADGWLEKKVKQTADSLKERGQDVIDAGRAPAKKMLPRVITKQTDKAADFVIEKRKKAEVAVDKFVDDPVLYLVRLPGSLFADVCSAPVQHYGKLMEQQARGKWKPLPAELIASTQDDYNVDLRSVQYVEGVTTSNGAAQTIGKRIYFPRSIDLTDADDLHWMLHEIEHTVQFANATYGTAGKLCEYVAKAVGSGARHDAIDMERAADAKANFLLDEALSAMTGDAGGFGSDTHQSLAANEVEITNTLTIPIVFEMATDALGTEPETLQPGESSVFSGDATDSQFYVRIGTTTWRGVVSRQHTIDGGSRTVIGADNNGIFDFFNAR